MKSKITQSLVERAPRPEPGKSALYADTEMRGFYLIVTATKRSFYVQSLVNGRQVKTKLGDHPAMDAKQARDAARQTLVGMRGGVNPNEERRRARARGITLREALDLHLAAKPLSPRTKDDYRYNCEQYLSDWLDRPLAELGADRSGVSERHRRITERHGAPSADNAFRIFRAVYNRGLREHPDLQPNPCGNVDYHGLRRRKRISFGPTQVYFGPPPLQRYQDKVLYLRRRNAAASWAVASASSGSACSSAISSGESFSVCRG